MDGSVQLGRSDHRFHRTIRGYVRTVRTAHGSSAKVLAVIPHSGSSAHIAPVLPHLNRATYAQEMTFGKKRTAHNLERPACGSSAHTAPILPHRGRTAQYTPVQPIFLRKHRLHSLQLNLQNTFAQLMRDANKGSHEILNKLQNTFANL